MDWTNAERQRRYLARLKAAAAAQEGGGSPAAQDARVRNLEA